MKKDWISTEKAAEALGLSVSQLYNLRSQGVFKRRKHYKTKNPIASRPTYLWNVEECEKVL